MTDHPFNRPPRRSRAEIVADAMLDVLLAATEKDAEAGLRSYEVTGEEVATLVEIACSQFGQGKRFTAQVCAALGEATDRWNADVG